MWSFPSEPGNGNVEALSGRTTTGVYASGTVTPLSAPADGGAEAGAGEGGADAGADGGAGVPAHPAASSAATTPAATATGRARPRRDGPVSAGAAGTRRSIGPPCHRNPAAQDTRFGRDRSARVRAGRRAAGRPGPRDQ